MDGAEERLLISDRGCPPDTALVRLMWHASGTAGENERLAPEGDGFQCDRWVRPVLAYRLPRSKSQEGLRQSHDLILSAVRNREGRVEAALSGGATSIHPVADACVSKR
jgi:hypothetical protein